MDWGLSDSITKMIAMVIHLGLRCKTSEFPIDVLEIQFQLKYENFLDMVHSEKLSLVPSCPKWIGFRKHRFGIQNLGRKGLEEAFLFHCTCICAAILLPISDSLSCIFPKFCCCCILSLHKGPSINYVVSVGGSVDRSVDDLLHRP